MSNLDERVYAAATRLEAHCKSLDLMNTDYGKAVLRIKVNGFSANLSGLTLKPGNDANWQEEAVGLALAAFQSAMDQRRTDSDGDRYGDGKQYVEAMERAVQSLD